jgi:hypothetical protein
MKLIPLGCIVNLKVRTLPPGSWNAYRIRVTVIVRS